MRMKLSLLFLFLALASTASAQNTRYDNVALGPTGRPIAGAYIAICTSAAVVGTSSVPCTPLATIVTSATNSTPVANPFRADGNGNFGFWAVAGQYTMQIYGRGFTTTFQPITVTCNPDSSNCGSGGGGGGNYQTIQDNGTPETQRPTLNFISGSQATVTCADNIGATRTDCTVASTASGANLSTDNKFTNNDRFKGPIPYRDVTAYMPQGGCSNLDTGDPPATGTISASTTSLSVSNGSSFSDGCGIAVMNAGATATVATASTATGTTTRVGTLVTFTITSGDAHLVPGIGSGSDFMGFVKVTGCSDSAFNTTGTGWLLNFGGSPATSFTYNSATSSGVSATGCTATFYYGYAHGTTGSTTWNYKVAPIDNKGGVGIAVGPITITNGNASLTPSNYNWIGYQYTTGARMFAIYRDDGAGGAYSCINISYSPGYSDWGRALPFGCPAFVPSTPPAAPTNQTLNTTIVSGGGTNTLVLAAAATSTATTKNVYHDESSFLASCITDAVADQNGNGSRTVGSYGCYIPAGRYFMNADMPTDTIAAVSGLSGGISIKVAGSLVFQSWPWIIGAGYDIEGEGSSAGTAATQSFPTTYIERGLQMPSGMVIHGSKVTVSNFSLGNMMGHGMYIGADVANAGTTAGISVNNVALNVQDGYGIGVPLMIDSNALFYGFNNMIFVPRTDGYPASILFTSLAYSGNGHSDISFNNIFTQYHHICIDSPGGQNTGQGTAFTQTGYWRSEEHGQYATGGLICLDGGAANLPIGAESTAGRLARGIIHDMENADASEKHLLTVKGTQSVYANVYLYNSDQFITQPRCDSPTVITPCQTAGVSLLLSTDSLQVPSGLVKMNGPVVGSGLIENVLGYPVVTSLGYGTTGADFSNQLPAPYGIEVTGTGVGSLSAGTYCFVVAGLDRQATPGYTTISPEICQTVGASAKIDLRWYLLYYDSYYSNFRLYFGTSAGNETSYFVAPAVSSLLQTYSFTTVAGASAGAPVTASNGTARTSWLGPLSPNGSSCILCTPFSANTSQQLGIGDSAPPAGSKLSVKGGFLNAPYLASIEAAAPSGIASSDILYPDSTAHRWKMKNNNGAAETLAGITGSTTIGNCVQFAAGPTIVDAGSSCGGGAGGANVALSNLAGVGINTSLLPGASNTVSLGSNALAFTNLFVGTVTNQSWSLDSSALTANRTTTIPDAATVLPQPCTVTANQWMKSISATTGACTKAQPAFTDISGIATTAQLPYTYSGNTTEVATVTGAVTSTHVATWDADGNLVDGGTAVSASSTNTFTNKTYSQEGTGNVLTTVNTAWSDSAGCNNSTAGASWDLPTANQPTPQCLTGSNTQQGVLDYDDAVAESAQYKFALPHTWTGNIDINLYWLVTASGGSNAVKWTVATACSTAGATYDTVYNAPQTITTNVGANNIVTISSQTTITVTGCSVDSIMHLKIGRDVTDTFTGTARMVGAKLVLRKTGS